MTTMIRLASGAGALFLRYTKGHGVRRMWAQSRIPIELIVSG
jgi:hypothetical protein